MLCSLCVRYYQGTEKEGLYSTQGGDGEVANSESYTMDWVDGLLPIHLTDLN